MWVHAIKNRDNMPTPVILKVKEQHLHLLNGIHLTVINIKLHHSTNKYKLSFNSVFFFSSYTCHKIFFTYRQTQRQTNIFKISQIVLNTSQNGSKTVSLFFYENNASFLFIWKKHYLKTLKLLTDQSLKSYWKIWNHIRSGFFS